MKLENALAPADEASNIEECRLKDFLKGGVALVRLRHSLDIDDCRSRDFRKTNCVRLINSVRGGSCFCVSNKFDVYCLLWDMSSEFVSVDYVLFVAAQGV